MCLLLCFLFILFNKINLHVSNLLKCQNIFLICLFTVVCPPLQLINQNYKLINENSIIIKLHKFICPVPNVPESEDGGSLLGSSRKSLADTSVTSTADLSVFSGGQRSQQAFDICIDDNRSVLSEGNGGEDEISPR